MMDTRKFCFASFFLLQKYPAELHDFHMACSAFHLLWGSLVTSEGSQRDQLPERTYAALRP